mmetsp:Transcript_46836/g.150325  ORF Transcript_46836/g.150325 Transcript_46836/m.150325 type:complete len:306 (-) Transcript_46836:87-1004(-)
MGYSSTSFTATESAAVQTAMAGHHSVGSSSVTVMSVARRRNLLQNSVSMAYAITADNATHQQAIADKVTATMLDGTLEAALKAKLPSLTSVSELNAPVMTTDVPTALLFTPAPIPVPTPSEVISGAGDAIDFGPDLGGDGEEVVAGAPEVDGCADSPCWAATSQGLAVECTDIPDSGADFSCGACPIGYSGDGIGSEGCAPLSLCAAGPCYPGVACSEPPATSATPDVALCGECPAGFEGAGFGPAGCEDVDECADSPCDDLATPACANTAGSFECGACPGTHRGNGLTGCKESAPMPATQYHWF